MIAAVGFRCSKGERWIRQEIESPLRTIATSVSVRNGDFICASVRTRTPVPLEKIPEVMRAIRTQVLEAPVSIGQVVLSNPAGTSTRIIVTREVKVGKEKEKSGQDA